MLISSIAILLGKNVYSILTIHASLQMGLVISIIIFICPLHRRLRWRIRHAVFRMGRLPTTAFRHGTWWLGIIDPFIYISHPSNIHAHLMVVWDGRDYLRRGRLVQIIENLVHQGRMRPVALAMVDDGRLARMAEYACSEGTLGFLMERVLPLAREHLNLVETGVLPGSFGIMGASMGGLMALYSALRLPQIFSHVLSQSGGFWRGKVNSIVFDLVEKWETLPLDIWMDVGRYDFSDLLESNRYLFKSLHSRGYPVVYREYPGGHNYPAWRDEVWRGLEYLFPAKS